MNEISIIVLDVKQRGKHDWAEIDENGDWDEENQERSVGLRQRCIQMGDCAAACHQMREGET